MCNIKSTGENHIDDDDDDDSTSDTDEEYSSMDSTSDSDNAEDGGSQDGKVDNDNDESEEDEVVKAIRQELEKERVHPPDIVLEEYVVDISFHPVNDIIAVGTITGDVILYKYSNESTEILNTLEVHTKACRDIEFDKDGNTLFSSSKDKSIMLSDVSTGKLKHFYDNAHENPIYSLLVMDHNLIASGDDNGVVKLWDIRKKDAICSFNEVEDYVSCMITTDSQRYLAYASGEGTLTSINLNKRKLYTQSELYETEFTSLALMKNETKLLVGSTNGVLYIFNWGEFGYHNDEYPGPEHAINCMVPVTENIVVCGRDDGVLRGVNVFPQRHVGVVGQHQFAVESADISCDGQFIASCSHDQNIKFWNIKYFQEFTIDDTEKAKKKDVDHNLPSSRFTNASDFFSGLT